MFMEAKAKSLHFFGECKELVVPFFQRRYVWEKDNWKELLQNFEQGITPPFLGSIILKEESGNQSTIIDGQQRLTTITILAKALYDSLSVECKKPNSGIRSSIENYLFYRDNAADNFEDSQIRICHSKIDKQKYDRIISAEMLPQCSEIDLDAINEESSRIEQCYQFYREELRYWNDDALKRMFNSMFDKNKKVLVLIELKHGDVNEQVIFDTINRAGVHLSTADIIKNNYYKHFVISSPNLM